jgi:lipopolysaccharide export LptBFGC system permease protein LptF
MVLCTMLGIALMPSFSRRSIAHSLFGRGLTIGFVAMIVQGVMLAFAESGLFIPEVAAWFVPAALFCIILACSEALPVRRPRTASLAPT